MEELYFLILTLIIWPIEASGQNKCFRLYYASYILSEDVEILPWSQNEINLSLFDEESIKDSKYAA